MPLTQLAHKHLAFEPTDISEFQRKARILQSMWREERGYEAAFFRGKQRGNYLLMPWAKDTLNNYLSGTIKEVVRREVISSRNNGKLYGSPRIFNNLLSSQPLCFNLFAELQQDLNLATRVFQQLCPDRIAVVTAIEFEHSPSRGNLKYTGDSSAFRCLRRIPQWNWGEGFRRDRSEVPREPDEQALQHQTKVFRSCGKDEMLQT